MIGLCPHKSAALGAFGFAQMTTDKTFEGFDQTNAFVVPEEGGNHAAWIAGHLAQTYDWLLTEMGEGSALPASYKELFGQNSVPSDEPGVYPPFEELLSAMRGRRSAALEWFTALPDGRAAEPLKEEWREFGQTYAGMIGALGAHENFHAGQLSVVRKKLGFTRVFG